MRIINESISMTEHTVQEWELKWDDSEQYVIFKGYDSLNRSVIEFSLDSISYANLYYALKDWYSD